MDNIQREGNGYSPSLGGGATILEAYVGNPNIQWEIAKKGNIGLEFGLFNQVKFTIDVFNEKRDNVLIPRGLVPDLNGVPANSRPPVNIGIVENKGYEIEMNYNKVISNQFSFFSKVNFNYAKNLVVFSDEPERTQDYAYSYRQTGYPIGQNWGYIVDGYFNSEQDIANHAKYEIGRNPKPGDLKYRDITGDGIVNDRDIAPIGHSSVPQYTFGGAIGFDYKGFNFSVLLQGVSKVSTFFSDIGVFEQYDFRERHKYSWTPERFAANEEIRYPALG
ncbi:MAG: TonB-dependent receptor, partial [Pedobacter sp.]